MAALALLPRDGDAVERARVAANDLLELSRELANVPQPLAPLGALSLDAKSILSRRRERPPA